MFRIPGTLSAHRLGDGWIDEGTLSLTRMPSPSGAGSALQAKPVRPLTPTEQRILAALELSGIGDRNEQAMFLAQVSLESAGFRRLRENLRYSAAGLRKTFPKYVKTDADAKALASAGGDAIANRVYGSRLGNDAAGDGARYLGRGYIQLTGKSNYKAAGDALGLDLVTHPELAEDPSNALRIAIWFWQQNVSSEAARLGNVTKVTKQINGGAHGLEDRKRLYLQYLERLPRTVPLQRPKLGEGVQFPAQPSGLRWTLP